MADFKGFKIDGQEYPWGDYVTVGQKAGTTLGQNATAEGCQTTASGEYGAHAEGYFTEATNSSTHAEGRQTRASGQSSHAEGSQTMAHGSWSHAQGYNTTANGSCAHAEGNYAEAPGYVSHAEGEHTTASGTYSHTSGEYTIATHRNQYVFGAFNQQDPSDTYSGNKGTYIEIVGNGTSNSKRSNARTLDWDGNEVLAGKLTVGSAPTNNMDVATKQYVDTTHQDLSDYATKDYVDAHMIITPKNYTLHVADWDTTTNTINLTSAAILDNSNILIAPAFTSQLLYYSSNIVPMAQNTGSITLQCTTIPDNDIDIILVII